MRLLGIAATFFLLMAFVSTAKAQDLVSPYPIIFIHGLTSNYTTWTDTTSGYNDVLDYLRKAHFVDGKHINVCLDVLRDSLMNSIDEDVELYTRQPESGDFYAVNFDVHSSKFVPAEQPGWPVPWIGWGQTEDEISAQQDTISLVLQDGGSVPVRMYNRNDLVRIDNEFMLVENWSPPDLVVQRGALGSSPEAHSDNSKVFNLSMQGNQASIAKQGRGLKLAIDAVKLVTGAEKVILVGHSMGGLAAREYIRSAEYGGDVAKLVTTGTPHLGSVADWTNIAGAFNAWLDTRSDGVRDVRYTYDIGFDWFGRKPRPPFGDRPDDAVFLFGGRETDPFPTTPYYSHDFNGNGTIDGGEISGLSTNLSTLPTDVDYNWIVSQVGILVGDYAVRADRQYPWYSETAGGAVLTIGDTVRTGIHHGDEPKDEYSLIRGIDEPDSMRLAYELGLGRTVHGFISLQKRSRIVDNDWYSVTAATGGNLFTTIDEDSAGTGVTGVTILDSDGAIIGGTTISSFPTTIETPIPSAGKYFVVVIGNATSTTWQNAYSLVTSFGSNPNSPVAWYKLDGNYLDASSSGNNGAPSGTPVFVPDRFGNPSSACSFDGNDNMTAATVNLPVGNSTRTIALWVYSSSFAQANRFLAGWGSPNQVDAMTALVFGLNNAPSGKPGFWGWGDDIMSWNPVANDDWHHIAFTYDASMIGRLYVDGVPDSTRTLSLATPSGTVFYVADFIATMGNFSGTIDDIRVYDRALTPSEILDLYNEGSVSSGWASQTSGTTEWLEAVNFTDANTGWAVGWGGTILHTTSGGSSWNPQTSGTTEILSSVYFADASNGWAVGHGGSILRTKTGGSIWKRQVIGAELHWVHFSGAVQGWAVGEGGSIWHTTNGGVSWTAQTSGTTVDLNSVQFLSASIGWAVGQSGTILKTTNGGSSWNSQTSGTTSSFFSVHFSDLSTGWAVGDGGTVLHTTNAGSTWSIQASGTSVRLEGVHFINANTGWAVGDAGTIRNTTDGGLSWNPDTSGTTWRLYAVHFPVANSGWAVGANGTILHYGSGTAIPTVLNTWPNLDEEKDIPIVFTLNQNYPNPFNPSTTISYQLPVDAHVILMVSDIMGREVATLVDGSEEAGNKSVIFDANNLASGIYFYRLQAGSFVETKKLILMK